MRNATTMDGLFPRLDGVIARNRRNWLDVAELATGTLVLSGLIAALLSLG